MAKRDNLTTEFLNALNEIEIRLFDLSFKKHSFLEKGFACYIDYKKENGTQLAFLFGPSDWGIEIILYASESKFALKDLFAIPEVNNWVNKNRYKQENGRNLKKELEWYVDLLKVCLPYIE